MTKLKAHLSKSLKAEINQLEGWGNEGGEDDEDPSALRSLRKLQELGKQLRKRLAGLEEQEDDFNKNVQMVVETDEKQMKLNEDIIHLKKQMDLKSPELEAERKKFKEVKDSRLKKFMEYFDAVAASLKKNYASLTESGENFLRTAGQASLSLVSREDIFEILDGQ